VPASVPNLVNRVICAGSLCAGWIRVSKKLEFSIRADSLIAPTDAPAVHKKSKKHDHDHEPHAPAPRVPRRSCAWCLQALDPKARKDARYHAGCRRSASRALGALSPLARQLADRLVRRRWPVRAALAAVRERVLQRAAVGLDTTQEPLGRMPESAPICSCGAPLAARVGARTCGRNTCRMRALRQRRALEDLYTTPRPGSRLSAAGCVRSAAGSSPFLVSAGSTTRYSRAA
jgi:hypothetical protein